MRLDNEIQWEQRNEVNLTIEVAHVSSKWRNFAFFFCLLPSKSYKSRVTSQLNQQYYVPCSIGRDILGPLQRRVRLLYLTTNHGSKGCPRPIFHMNNCEIYGCKVSCTFSRSLIMGCLARLVTKTVGPLLWSNNTGTQRRLSRCQKWKDAIFVKSHGKTSANTNLVSGWRSIRSLMPTTERFARYPILTRGSTGMTSTCSRYQFDNQNGNNISYLSSRF